jgi:hypothetical protein
MAIKWPLANGVWSNADNWNDGTLPDVGDDVHADGKTVTIDVANITVLSLRSDQRSGGIMGGSFQFQTAGDTYNITADIYVGFISSTTQRTITLNGGITLNLIGNLYGSLISGNASPRTISCDSVNSTLNIVGNLYAGIGGGGVHRVIGLTSNNVKITIIGNLYQNASGTNHTGVIGPIQVVWGGASPTFQNNIDIDITGNIYSNGASGHATVNLDYGNNSKFNITGTIFAANTGGSRGLQITLPNLNNTVTIDTVASEGTSNLQSAVTITGNSTYPDAVVEIDKIILPPSLFTQMVITSSLVTVITKEIILPTALKLENNNLFIEGTNSLNEQIYLTQNSDISPRLPVESNVRQGVSYNSGLRVGTILIPDSSDVRRSIPVDNTIGTADLSAEGFLTEIENSSNPIAIRLRNVATVETVGEQFVVFST